MLFASSMLERISERKGHLAAIYALKRGAEGIYSAAADGFIVHWHKEDVDFGTVVAKVDGGKFFCLELLEEGGLVAGAVDGGVHWLYPERPEDNLHVAHHRRGVYAIQRIGNDLYTAGGDGVLTRWDVQRKRTVESIQLSPNSLRCITPYRGGELLIIGSSDGKVHTVDRENLALVGSANANQPSTFCVATFPEDFPAYVSGGRDAQLRFGQLGFIKSPILETIDAHVATINDLAFSPNGKYLATASRDKTVKLWEANPLSFKLLKVAEVVRDRGHINSVNTLLWWDDHTLYTAGDDRRILEWKVG